MIMFVLNVESNLYIVHGVSGKYDMPGVMSNYLEINVWKLLRNALQNGYDDFVYRGDIDEVIFEMLDSDKSLQKYIDNGHATTKEIEKAINDFRNYKPS